MILPIVKFGHPVLRQKGKRIERLTSEVEQLIADMLETMRDAHGLGLAAQQVGRALQLTVLDVREAKDRPSTLLLDGQPGDVAAFMPLVLVNPEVNPLSAAETGTEGCLSFPEIYAEISRPESVEVRALNKRFERIKFRCGGLLARAIQHEVDHLNGILFIDRMDIETKRSLKPKLEDMRAATRLTLEAQASPLH